MNTRQTETARACLHATEANTMTFPQAVGALMQAGFESYVVDFRRATKTYYLPDGESLVLETHRAPTPIPPALDTDVVKAALREAQLLVPGYSYLGFCAKVMAAGCVGYMVSFSGRRAVYFGRAGETHVEHFPQ